MYIITIPTANTVNYHWTCAYGPFGSWLEAKDWASVNFPEIKGQFPIQGCDYIIHEVRSKESRETIVKRGGRNAPINTAVVELTEGDN
jgi:hypothetical protein